MYLRRSTLHNHDVVLVLNCDSGLVIPKFHVHYEPLFTTTKDFDSSSLWQERVRFVWLAGHNLSRADRLSKCAALSTHPYPHDGGNVLAWIHQPLVATLNQRETLVSNIDKRETLMKDSLHKREHPLMKSSLNQGYHPNLMHVYLNKREHPMMKFPLNKR